MFPFMVANVVVVMFAHRGKPPPSLSDRHPGLPHSMDAAVIRAMAKSKDNRWPTCTALVAALDAALGSQAAPAPARTAPAGATQVLHRVDGEAAARTEEVPAAVYSPPPADRV